MTDSGGIPNILGTISLKSLNDLKLQRFGD
jgi:hypothetical protein